VRGGDLSCEGSSSRKLFGDAAVRSRTGRLASEGLDEDPHAFPETQHQVKGGLLQWRTAVSPTPRATIWAPASRNEPKPYATVCYSSATVYKSWADA
jgi:hypothetical protein